MPVEDGEWEDEVLVPPPAEPHWAPQDPDPEAVEEPSADFVASEPEPEPIPEFDLRVREDFEGLLYLGRLTDRFDWLGHNFLIRTLTVGEILEVGLMHREYVGTMGEVKAYQAAVVAACCVEVDGQPIAVPLTNERTDTELLNKFRYVLRSWYPPTLDAIYERYRLLELRVEEVLKAMGEAHGWTDSTRTSSGTSV